MTEAQRAEFLARVLRKEYLTKLCEHGKITLEEYLGAINQIRAIEQLPPLTLADAGRLPRQVRHRTQTKIRVKNDPRPAAT